MSSWNQLGASPAVYGLTYDESSLGESHPLVKKIKIKFRQTGEAHGAPVSNMFTGLTRQTT